MFILSHLAASSDDKVFRVFYWNGDENNRIYIPEGDLHKEMEKIEKDLEIPHNSIDLSLSTEIIPRFKKKFVGPYGIPVDGDEIDIFTSGKALCKISRFYCGTQNVVHMRIMTSAEQKYVNLMIQRANHLVYNELWGRLGLEEIVKVDFDYSSTESIIDTAELKLLCVNVLSASLTKTLIKDWHNRRKPFGCKISFKEPHISVTVNNPTGCPVMSEESMSNLISSYIMGKNSKYNTVQFLNIQNGGRVAAGEGHFNRSFSVYTSSPSNEVKSNIETYLLRQQQVMSNSILCELVTISEPVFRIYPINSLDYEFQATRKLLIEWDIPYKMNGLVSQVMLRQYVEDNIAEITNEFDMKSVFSVGEYYSIYKCNVDIDDEVIHAQTEFCWSDPNFDMLPF